MWGVCAHARLCVQICAGVAHECGGCKWAPGGQGADQCGSVWGLCGLCWLRVLSVVEMVAETGESDWILWWVPFLSVSIGGNPSKPDHPPMCASQLRVPPILASQIWRPNLGGICASQILASQLRVPTWRPSWGGPWRVPFGVFIKVLARGRPSGRPNAGGGSPRPNLASQPGVPIWRPNLRVPTWGVLGGRGVRVPTWSLNPTQTSVPIRVYSMFSLGVIDFGVLAWGPHCGVKPEYLGVWVWGVCAHARLCAQMVRELHTCVGVQLGV